MGNPTYTKDTVEKEKKNIVFWAVDCQKDFILPSGKLYVKGAEEILPNLSKLTSLAVRENLTVISTGDYHSLYDKEISNTPDFINTFPPHCIAYEEGSEFVNETYPKLLRRHYCIITPLLVGEIYWSSLERRAKDIILYKNEFDIFKGNKYVDEILKIIKPDIIVIYGVATDYCIRYTVEGVLERGYDIVVVQDAIKGIDKNKSDYYLENWYERRVKILNTEEVEGFINGNS